MMGNNKLSATSKGLALDNNFRGAVRKFVLLLILVALGWYLSGAYAPRINDFPAYYEAGRVVLEGRPGDLYSKLSVVFTNLPALSLLFTPLALFEYDTAWHILWWSSIASFVATLLLLAVSVRTRKPSDGASAFLPALIFLAYAPIMHRCLVLGQTTPLAVMLLAICVFLLLRGHNIGAGLALGALCALKIPPLLLLGVFAARRRWATVATAVAVLILTVSASWLWLGTEGMSQYAERVFGANTRGGLAAFNNQSLDGLWMRTFSDAGLTNWTPSPRPYATTIATSLSLLVIAIGVLLTGWKFFFSAPAIGRSASDTNTVELEVGLGAALMVLVLPVTWTHYFLLLSVPFALLPIWWQRNNLPGIRLATGVLLTGVLLTTWPHVHENSYYAARETLGSLRLILAGRTVGALLLLGLCMAGMILWNKTGTAKQSDRASAD
jgi:hypothetical protein